MNSAQPQNKMGVMPIDKLVISMSAPMMVSMLIQALYNVVDSIFVARITDLNDFPLRAVSMAFPAQSLMIAVSVGTGVGVNALLSRRLGAKDFKGANQVATTGVFLAFCSYLVFALLGIFLVKPFFEVQVADVADAVEKVAIIEYGWQYLSICMIASFGIFFQIIFERLLQSTGKTLLTMCTQGIGAIVNIIFDPIFIFVFDLGVAGAALATVLGQIVAMILAIIFNLKLNKEVKVNFRSLFKADGKTILAIYGIALPSIIMQSIGSVMVFTLNKILGSLDGQAITVFGIYFKLQSFVFMPVMGLNNGLVPIVAYNYGAENRKRIIQTVKCASLYALVIMTVGMAIIQIFPKPILSLFNPPEAIEQMSILALRIISTHFVLAAISIVLSSTFQALGKAVFSMLVSIARQLVVLLPAAFLLSLTGNVNNVWWAFPIAEVMSLAMCLIFFVYIYKKMISKIPSNS